MSVTLFQCQQRHNEWVRQKYSAGQKRETLDQLTDFLKQHSWREETDGREIREKTEADKQVRGAQSFWPCSSDNSWELLDEFSSLRFSFKIISTFVTIPLRKLVHLKNCCFQLTKNSFGLKGLQINIVLFTWEEQDPELHRRKHVRLRENTQGFVKAVRQYGFYC